MAEFDITTRLTLTVPDSITIFNDYCEIRTYPGEVYWKCERRSSTNGEIHEIEICLKDDGTLVGGIDGEAWYERDILSYKEPETKGVDYAIEDAVDWIEEHFERCVKDMQG